MDASAAASTMNAVQAILTGIGLILQFWALMSLVTSSPSYEHAQAKYTRGIGLALMAAIYLASAKSYL